MRFLRKKNGLSQEAFAEAIGFSSQSIGSYEQNRCESNIKKLVAICDFFDVPLNDFILTDLTISEGGNKN